MTTAATLHDDLEFALASGEFRHLTPAMRYVAALNPDCTRAEFVNGLGDKYDRQTLTKQFGLSRKFWLEWVPGSRVDAEGRYIEA